ncbi:hypothetical protein EJB05_38467, partial [Eragrostis curvula]
MACIGLRARVKQCFSPRSLRSYLAEFVATFLCVVIAISPRIITQQNIQLTADPKKARNFWTLLVTALFQVSGLSTAVWIATDISGGHFNPAVTFSFAISGHIGVLNAIFYWAVPITMVAGSMSWYGASIWEGMMTFFLVCAVLVAGDPRRAAGGNKKRLTVLLAGLVTVVCVLAMESQTGASLNPARSFGAAVVSGQFHNQAVYWVGPMIGGAVAALVCRFNFLSVLEQCLLWFNKGSEPPRAATAFAPAPQLELLEAAGVITPDQFNNGSGPPQIVCCGRT